LPNKRAFFTYQAQSRQASITLFLSPFSLATRGEFNGVTEKSQGFFSCFFKKNPNSFNHLILHQTKPAGQLMSDRAEPPVSAHLIAKQQ
jgi:hypothetical protein